MSALELGAATDESLRVDIGIGLSAWQVPTGFPGVGSRASIASYGAGRACGSTRNRVPPCSISALFPPQSSA